MIYSNNQNRIQVGLNDWNRMIIFPSGEVVKVHFFQDIKMQKHFLIESIDLSNLIKFLTIKIPIFSFLTLPPHLQMCIFKQKFCSNRQFHQI